MLEVADIVKTLCYLKTYHKFSTCMILQIEILAINNLKLLCSWNIYIKKLTMCCVLVYLLYFGRLLGGIVWMNEYTITLITIRHTWYLGFSKSGSIFTRLFLNCSLVAKPFSSMCFLSAGISCLRPKGEEICIITFRIYSIRLIIETPFVCKTNEINTK